MNIEENNKILQNILENYSIENSFFNAVIVHQISYSEVQDVKKILDSKLYDPNLIWKEFSLISFFANIKDFQDEVIQIIKHPEFNPEIDFDSYFNSLQNNNYLNAVQTLFHRHKSYIKKESNYFIKLINYQLKFFSMSRKYNISSHLKTVFLYYSIILNIFPENKLSSFIKIIEKHDFNYESLISFLNKKEKINNF
tara:strand:+ start:3728 stop:4315 length:588 start_codon:yes stop_codon:yes gene_type:complete